MKNITLSILFFCILPTLTIAQSTFSYFNKIYKTDTTNELAMASYPIEDGYLTTGVVNSLNHYAAFYARKIDWEGNIVWQKILEEGQETVSMVGGNTLTPTSDGNFVTVGEKATYYPGLGDLRAVIIKFNKEGEVLWKKFHGDTTTAIYPLHVLETKDKGFIMAGSWRLVGSWNNFYVLKVDSLGNVEWERKYNPSHHGSAFSIQETLDGGYIVGGYRFKHPNNPTENADAYMLKIDSLGNKQWDKTFGGPHTDGGTQIKVTEEGDYIIAWNLREEDNTPLEIDNPLSVRMMKLNSIGEVLIEKIYHIDEVRSIGTAILSTSDNGFIATGLYDSNPYSLNSLVYRFDENLDTLWTKPVSVSESSQDYVKNMLPTPDGGYILTGFDYTNQQSWIVKIDSLGNTCSYVGCDSTITIPPPLGISSIQKQATLQIAPNPIHTENKATITLPNISLYHQVTLQVFTATGQLVQEQMILPYQKEVGLSTEFLANGVYFCRLVGDGKRIEEGKLVIVR